MTSTTLLQRAAAVLAAGGLAWLAKMAVIAASDGAAAGLDANTASVFFILGVVLMCSGLVGIAFALSAGRHRVLRVLSAIGGFVAFFAIFVVLEELGKGVAGQSGPSWFEDEVGILVTGTVLMTAGLLTVRSTTAP